MTAIKEIPILFSGPMVRAILEGRKTVTRRVVKPQPSLPTTHWWPSNGHGPQWMADGPSEATGGTRQTWGWKECPYGQPGDRLWVRETYFAFGRWETRYSAKKGRDEWHFVDMTHDTGRQYQFEAPVGQHVKISRGSVTPSWWKRPSIFIPRCASRILLEITNVRVERLNDISEDQALAEGVTFSPVKPQRQSTMGRDAFADLWASINGFESWEANPWVWVVEFKRIEQ